MSIPPEIYAHGFNLIEGIGPKRLGLILAGFPDAQAAWQASLSELMSVGVEEKYAVRIVGSRGAVNLEAEEEKLQKAKVRVLLKQSEAYPPLLKETVGAPEVLYCKGSFNPETFCLAIVGSRKVSPYGKRAAETLAGELARADITIVSGLAYGVDYMAQNEAVKAGRPTVAVLGNGLDEASIYPAAHRRTANQIAENGCLLSEYPLGVRPQKYHFPARNRIISGISRGTLVVEAGEKSGSLITAEFALEQNREVFAVPGSIFSPNSAGTNNLIRNGAIVVTRAEDILQTFNLNFSPPRQTPTKSDLSPAESAVLEHLDSEEPRHIDEIAKLSGIGAAELGSVLMVLEIKNAVQNIGGMKYIKK